MRTRLAKRHENEGGFTLIELLIVIVVLGVLAGIVVFGVGTFRQDAVTAAKGADCKTVSVAAEAFAAKSPTGAYPANVQKLVDDKYIKSVPTSMTGATAIDADGKAAGC
ncbi:competence type IV pilus major pilin ComGC [Nocardioides piscis]|uniref:Prepilin-type N-terminal cleavage/methylation domain-containing protein n=1 Tax=Nocardioides piscis TaxID=2714938 RepID=A0A6G7YEI8_9ACTN|nr:prepilin-type N-terminal cleavage/methylation domain-containing protein [Nocardioides piscis]QIK75139.1 prepilin-type N-terminal cleavage/methylation domain-containing protein [Nocardioides piscis]